MKKSLFAGVVVAGLAFAGAALAADEKFTGVLIDTKCSAKPMKDENPETAASKHPKACTIKCAKDGDLVLISGKEAIKLDEASKAKAVEFLGKEDSKTKATVTGTKKGDTLTITSIEAAK
jgi:hypothetical protein